MVALHYGPWHLHKLHFTLKSSHFLSLSFFFLLLSHTHSPSLSLPRAQIRDTVSWISDQVSSISSDEPAQSVQAAEELLSKHSQVRAEIDAREEDMSSLVRAGERMIAQQHYAGDEVSVVWKIGR